MVAECKQLVQQYLPQLLRILEAASDRHACTVVGMCDNDDLAWQDPAGADAVSQSRRLMMGQPECAPRTLPATSAPPTPVASCLRDRALPRSKIR